MSAPQPSGSVLQTVLDTRDLRESAGGAPREVRDLRDPSRIGEAFLATRKLAKNKRYKRASEVLDANPALFAAISPYEANPSTLEKYPPHPGAGSPAGESFNNVV